MREGRNACSVVNFTHASLHMKLHLPLKLRNAVLSLVYPVLTLAAGVMPLAMAATITYDGSDQVMVGKGSGDTSGNDYVLVNGVRFVLESSESSGMFVADGNNVGTIWVGNATMVFDDADTSPIYFNNGASKTLGSGGYTIRVMDDGARIRVGSNQFLTIADLRGVAQSGSTIAANHDVTIQGNARGIMINQASALNNLNITGGIVTLGNASAAMTGAVHGTLTVGGKSHVTLASNNILAADASGIVVTSDLVLGSTTQTLYDGMSVELKNGVVEGMIGSSEPGQGLVVNDNAKVLLSYSGKSNSVSVDIAVNAGASLTVNNVGTGIYTDNGLVLSGSLSGTGELHIGAAEGMGMGSVTLAGDNTGYTGNVTLNDGSVLTIGHKNALSGAESVTVGRGAYIYEQVGHVDLHNLIIHDGATFVLQDVSTSYEVSSANAAFSVDALRFVEGNKEGYGLMFDNTLDTMEVITLVYSDTAIDNLDLSKFLIYDKDASGKQHKLEAGEYSLGVREMADGGYAFYMVTLFGNIWNGGEGGDGSWSGSSNWEGHAYDASEYNYAIFTNKSGVTESVVNLDGQTVSPERLYIFTPLDNGEQTDYVLKNGTVAGGAEIHKRGDNVGDVISSVRFEGVTGGSRDNALGWVTVSGGRMELTQNSTFYYDGSKMVQVDADAVLSIDSSSALISRAGNTITAFSSSTPASLYGLKISDDVIVGGDSRGYATGVKDAALTGFTVQDLTLGGTGRLTDGGLGAKVTIANGADWTFAGTLSVDGTVTNKGTMHVTGVTQLDFSGVDFEGSASGTVTYTFKVVDGGSIDGWSSMADNSASKLIYNGTQLSKLNGVTVTASGGSITLNMGSSGLVLREWDENWYAQGRTDYPAFAKVYSGSESSTAFTSDSAYQSSTMTGGNHGTVINVAVSAKGTTLAGGNAAYTGDIWMYDEGSSYDTKVGGLTGGTLSGNTHLYINGGKGTTVYGSSNGSNSVKHEGKSFVSIAGGTYTTVYGGGNNVTQTGDTHIFVYDGASITNVYGGSTGNSTHNGLAEIFLDGGNVTNVYGAGSSTSKFTGRTFTEDTVLNGVTIKAGDKVSSLIHLSADVRGLSLLDGDAYGDLTGVYGATADENHPNGKHILHFMDKEAYYDLSYTNGGVHNAAGVTIQDFTDIVLADDAYVKANHLYTISSINPSFENGEVVTISGKGTVELVGQWKNDVENEGEIDGAFRTIYLKDNARLFLNTEFLGKWASLSITPFQIVHVSDGTTLETTGNPTGRRGSNVHMHAYLEGDGVDGKGAWYKGTAAEDDDGSHTEMAHITLTNDASAGGEGTMYMNAFGYTNSVLDLTNGTIVTDPENVTLPSSSSQFVSVTSGGANYTFTKVGTSMLGLKNTHIEGGTLNILDGSVNVTAIVTEKAREDYCSATRTDVVLGKLGTLVLDYMTSSNNVTSSVYNQFNVASLAGEGAVQLQEHGSLNIIVNQTAFYSEFLNDQSISYYNESGYGYAVYSGAITSEMGGLVSKAGAGTQYFTGSESTYGSSVSAASGYSGTWITRGTLYLLGTSTASVFERGLTGVEKGVAGVGTIYWYEGAKTPEVGTLYLGNGVRIYNSGAVTLGTTTYSAWLNGLDVGKDGVVDMTIGVEAAPNGENLGRENAAKYLMMQEDPATGQFNKSTITRGGEEYVQINTANLSSISIDGMYMDGTTYVAGSEIDRNKMLLIKNSVWNNGDVDATVTGLNTAGYNEATYSGVLSDGVSGDGKTVKAKLVKVGEGTLTIDQKNEYTGGTDVKEGSLKLVGWATVGANEATNKVNMLQDDGSSIMLAYDNSYTNEQRSIVNDMVIKGRGDRRWDNKLTEGTDGETAALISDVGLGVDFLLDGAISGAGNLLHSGEGTLTLNGMSDYTLGTIITRSIVTVTSANGLGATAEGKSAALKLYEAATLRFMVGGENPDTHEALEVRGVNNRIDHYVAPSDAKLNAGIRLWMITELAAVVTDSYSGNSILGTIEIAGTDDVERVLAMTGNGYWATETVLSNYNGTLLFADEAATNKSLVSMYAANGTGYDGAGVITGSGTVAVSDIDTEDEADKDDTTYAWFDEMKNFTGSVVVEGTGAALEVGKVTGSYSWSVAGQTRTSSHAYVVSSGVTGDRGQVSVSGRGASFTAHGADIIVESGSSMNLTSNGHVQDVTYGKSFDISDVAAVVAPTVTISGGASFSVTNGATDYQYQITDLQNQNVVTPQDVLNPKLNGYDGLARGANVGFDGAEGYSYHYDRSRALNQTSVGAVGNVSANGTVLGGDLAFLGGSTYKAVMGNTNLCGGSLTLDVSEGLINLDIKLDGDFAEVAMANDRKVQIVLFTGVDKVTFFGVDETEQYTLAKEAQNAVYYTMAENYFSSPYINSDNVVYLVYDSSAGIVYLDIRVPEPTTTTLGILALAALAARRRRK